MSILRLAAVRPHHAYVLAGPEGCGKQLAARAFAAALLCKAGGCGECRDCALALEDHHPNLFVVEPEGRDIHVETVREEVWRPLFLTAPELGRKVFVIREADRLNPSAADVLLKVLEEPPADAVLMLLSARPDELPETILSRCHTVTFSPLAEEFVIEALAGEGVDRSTALLASRLAGGNLGRARRLARSPEGMAFRDVGSSALDLAAQGGPGGALAAADSVLAAADAFKKGLKDEFDLELSVYMDAGGRPDESYRGVITRIEARHKRRASRAQRDYLDWVLLAASTILRDEVLKATGGDPAELINLDLVGFGGDSAVWAASGMGAIERARAALADDTNLNARLVLEQAFLEISRARAA
jgi:DNA polymerase-3 subunit delta'